MSRNIIVGCSATQLNAAEKLLFSELQPWGLILFARNIDNPEQLTALIEQFKQALGRQNVMVFIDQEGGRVSRLPSKYWRVPPSPTVFANMFIHNEETAKRACLLNAILTGLELKAVGVNANCAPMLDIPQHDADRIVSERALGLTPQQVIALGTQISVGLKQVGVAPVIKHMPGHGRATTDSHKSLPVVSASLSSLIDWDFVPFKALADEPMAMTAHIVFTQIDPANPATISTKVIQQIMRETLGYSGLIMTDDINMHALSGDVATRAQQALQAGCDIVLHCSGELDEMKSLLAVTQELKGKSLARARAAEQIAFQTGPNLSPEGIKLELDALLSDYCN